MKVATLARYQPAEWFCSPSLKREAPYYWPNRRTVTGLVRQISLMYTMSQDVAKEQASMDRRRPGEEAQMKSPSEQLLGSWILLSHYSVRPDGGTVPVYGVNPKGIAVFDASVRL